MQEQVTTTSCDFCGYGGWLTRPEDFTHFAGGIDLCRECADKGTWTWAESGGHLVTLTDDKTSWSCSCGETFHRPLFTRPEVVAILPSVVRATANLHIAGRQPLIF